MAFINGSTSYQGNRYHVSWTNDSFLGIEVQDRQNGTEFDVVCNTWEEYESMPKWTDEQWYEWFKTQMPEYT